MTVDPHVTWALRPLNAITAVSVSAQAP